jgi:hypothetical protein
MKKEIQSKNKNITMTQKSVPKRMQTILSAITEFVVDIVGDKGNDNTIRQAITDRQDELITILKSNMPVQNNSLKKVKDPDAPKRGKSSYIYFCVEKRESIKEANPDMSAKDIIKELGRVWREDVNDKDKAMYDKLSTADKNRYIDEMKDYTPPPGTGKLVEKKSKRSKGPKRGLTAYIFYCTDMRDVLKNKNSELSTKEVTSLLGKGWRELSEKDRKPYAKLASKDKARYDEEKANWVNPDSDTTKKTQVKSAKKSSTRRKSGYILYCQEIRPSIKENNDGLTSQQVTKELGRSWNELDKEEQSVYNERANTPDDSTPVVKSSKKDKKVVQLPESESDLEELVEDESSEDESD